MSNSATASIRDSLVQFWNWWTGELADMIPQRMKDALKSRQRLDIVMGDDKTVLEYVASGQGSRMEEAQPLDNLNDDAWEQIAEFCDGQYPRLILTEEDCFRIDIDLPRQASGHLKEAVRLQLPVHSPLDPAAIDWNVMRTANSDKTSEAALLIARSKRLDALELLFAERGLMPPVIAGMVGSEPLTLRKPLIMDDGIASSIAGKAYLVSAILLLAIPFLTILGADWMTSNNLAQAEAIEASVIPKLQKERQARRQESQRRKLALVATIPSAARPIEEMASLLPSGKWLTMMSADPDKKISLTIDAGEQSDLLTDFAEAKAISHAAIVEEIPSEPNRALYQIEATLK